MPCLMPKDLLCRLDNRGMQRQTGSLSFKVVNINFLPLYHFIIKRECCVRINENDHRRENV